MLVSRGFADAKWYRIAKSKGAPDAARRLLHDGIDLALDLGR